MAAMRPPSRAPSAISGANALTTNADGTATLGGTVNAASVTLNDPASLNGGTVTTSGEQTYNGR